MNLVVDKLFVDNLKCSGCATTIKDTLLGIIGVSSVIVGTEEGFVEIEHEDFTDKETLIEKLASIGYPGKGTTNLLQTAQSYMSCIKGKFSN